MSGGKPTDFLAEREARGGLSKLSTLLTMSIQQNERKAVVPMSESTQLATRSSDPFSRALFTISTFDDAWRVATMLCKTSFVPSSYRDRQGVAKPEDVLAAIMMGAELGVGPLQALQGIAVINGRPSVWGDLALALAQRHPDFVDCLETIDRATRTATCTVKRRGREPVVRTYSWEEAETAGLTQKETYQKHPKRMIQMRARAFALRDCFADVLRGVAIYEEVIDYSDGTVTELPDVIPVPAIEAKVTNAPAPAPAPAPVAPAALPERSQAPVIQLVQAPASLRDFVIKSGKNAAKKVRELNEDQLKWYAGECKDVQTKSAAAFELEWRRKQLTAANNNERIDADGVVHTQVTQ